MEAGKSLRTLGSGALSLCSSSSLSLPVAYSSSSVGLPGSRSPEGARKPVR